MTKFSDSQRALVRNVVYGLAIGDAIGNPLEFRRNITKAQAEAVKRAPLRISDDTQMTLFLMEQAGIAGMPLMGHSAAYLRWYRTQIDPLFRGDGLLYFHEMFYREAPGATCLRSCMQIDQGVAVHNDSKGNGTVMRVAPIALRAVTGHWSLNQAVAAAEQDALTTHLHPDARHSSMFLTILYNCLMDVGGMSSAYADARRIAVKQGLPWDYLRRLEAITQDPEAYGGWVAEEALGMAIRFAADSPNYMVGVQRAAMIDGDGDTVASITGGLLGMMYGVPSVYVDKLVAKRPIEYALRVYCGD